MENTNDKMLTYAAASIIAVVLLVILLQWQMAPSYSAANDKVLEQVTGTQTLILPGELQQMAENGSLADYTLVDLRTNPDGQLPGIEKTIQIPFGELLEAPNLKKMKKAGVLLLIADDESVSQMAVALLTSKGINHSRAISNGYSQAAGNSDKKLALPAQSAHGEKARWDYGRFFKSEGGTTGSTPAGPAAVPQGVKVVKAAGGC